ncbi:PilZ domain-containing protein [Sphingomonas sp. ASV193]|uniref:PilZ domain-containing protein n=1 Tax=Sphingomonas sp. ASV193 TaxID=3144405 RepID=UPI0032E8A45A
MTNQFRQSLLSGNCQDVASLLRAKQAQSAQGDDLTSIVVPRAEARLGDHREGDRHRLTDEQVVARWGGTEQVAALINLSGGGAMIEADFAPRLWDPVSLSFGDGPGIEAAVRWIRDGRIGLEFAHETKIEGDAAVRDRVLLDVIHRSFPHVVAVQLEPARLEAPEDEDDKRRVERRHPLIWSGDLLYDHDTHPVRLRNISPTGALVDLQYRVLEGKSVMLDLGNTVTVAAHVSWVRGPQAGLSFEERFDLSRLAEARPEVAGSDWQVPGFLGQPGDATPWDKGWDRATLEELRADLEGFLRH